MSVLKKKPKKRRKPKTSQKRTAVRKQAPLRFTPYAWAKLLFLRDAGETEIGGFGVTAAADPLLVQEIVLVEQTCDWASVVFDDQAVADYFDRQVDADLSPQQFARIWVHTHPGNSAKPSSTDEETLARVFGHCDWSIMFILAQGGESYARLQFGVGPGGSLLLPVEVDMESQFPASDSAAWETEYKACVKPVVPDPVTCGLYGEAEADELTSLDPWSAWDRYVWETVEDDPFPSDYADNFYHAEFDSVLEASHVDA